MKLDVNCDLGEWEPPERTRALLRHVTSANIACGGHAGDVATMRRCARWARSLGVRIGAHPGPWSREDRGRSVASLHAGELELLLLQQVSALERIARSEGARLHHIKLHGALYHATDADETLARAYLRAVRRWWPGAIVYARAGGLVHAVANRMGLKVWPEAFADRGYRDDGSLIPREESGAIVSGTREVARRVQLLSTSGEIVAQSGKRLFLHPRTVCVHSDTPNALRIARAAAAALY